MADFIKVMEWWGNVSPVFWQRLNTPSEQAGLEHHPGGEHDHREKEIELSFRLPGHVDPAVVVPDIPFVFFHGVSTLLFLNCLDHL
jgi:hypothetical protein